MCMHERRDPFPQKRRRLSLEEIDRWLDRVVEEHPMVVAIICVTIGVVYNTLFGGMPM